MGNTKWLIFVWTGSIIGIIALWMLLGGMPLLLVYYLQYAPLDNWNRSAEKTACTIDRHEITVSECWDSDARHYYACYLGYVFIHYYDARHNNYSASFQAISALASKSGVQDLLDAQYGIGKWIYCYYQKENPPNWSTELRDTQWQVIGMVFLALIGTAITICLVLGCYQMVR